MTGNKSSEDAALATTILNGERSSKKVEQTISMFKNAHPVSNSRIGYKFVSLFFILTYTKHTHKD